MPALAPNSLIVITGITGYIGSHVGLAALQAGHRVRGTVRNAAKAEALKESYSKLGVDTSKVEIVTVDDLLSEEQYVKAFEGADGVAHVALPGPSPKWVEDTTEAVLSVFRASAKVGSVKRVVLTSSSVTLVSGTDFYDYPLTAKDWNEPAIKWYKNATEEDKKDFGSLYSAAKTLSEQDAWKWMKDNKPAFDFVTVCPNANFGPVLSGEPASTAAWITKLLKGDLTDAKRIPPQWYIDVRDDARLHIIGLTKPDLGGQRILGFAGPFGWNDVLAVLRKNFPHSQVSKEDIKGADTCKQKIDSELAKELLGGWIPFEKSVVDTGKSAGF